MHKTNKQNMIRHANQHIHRHARNRRFDDKNSRGGNVYTLLHDISSTRVTIDLTTRFLTFYVDKNAIYEKQEWEEKYHGKKYHNPTLDNIRLIITDDHKDRKKRKTLFVHSMEYIKNYQDIWYTRPHVQIEADSPMIWNGPGKVMIKCRIQYSHPEARYDENDRSELEHVGHVNVQKTGELVLV